LLSYLWAGIVVVSLVCAVFTGNLTATSAAAIEGASAAVNTVVGIAGAMLLWGGVMETMRRSGINAKIAKLLRPLLDRLFPNQRNNPAVIEAISANVSANLLGLGNVATPFGLAAMRKMKNGDTATADQCMLVVLNASSIQLIPTTIAAVRGSLGATEPFDILVPVWITSLAALSAGVLSARLMAKR